jgi:putative tricarboxylic transport membrane protein
MVSQGSFMPVFTRPVSLVLFLVIVWTVVSQFPTYRHFKDTLMQKIFRRKSCQADFDDDMPEER